MPIVTGEVTDRGAVVDILVGVSRSQQEQLERSGQPVPERIQIRAEVDTGSGMTVIAPWVVERLGLEPVGRVRFLTPSTGLTPHECDQYNVAVVLIGPGSRLRLPTVPVAITAFPPPDQGEVQAVLGRDVLGDCLLVYNGSAGAFTLAF